LFLGEFIEFMLRSKQCMNLTIHDIWNPQNQKNEDFSFF